MAGSRGADHTQYLAAIGVDIEIFEDIPLAEAGRQAAHPDHSLAAVDLLFRPVSRLFEHHQ